MFARELASRIERFEPIEVSPEVGPDELLASDKLWCTVRIGADVCFDLATLNMAAYSDPSDPDLATWLYVDARGRTIETYWTALLMVAVVMDLRDEPDESDWGNRWDIPVFANSREIREALTSKRYPTISAAARDFSRARSRR